MLDSQMLEQLKEVFTKLENEVTLVYKPSAHQDHAELVEMLNAVGSTSSKIKVEVDSSSGPSAAPEFYIKYNGKPNGISVKGIPGGHEFTSLIVAILNSDGKGKLPDPRMLERIKRFKGPIEVKTYISLSCENCPDVVQALNLMASTHGNFKHQMIDGVYEQDEIKRLGIQGVPSVIVNDKLVHSGRSNLLELVGKIEQLFGVSDEVKKQSNEYLGHYDVAVIGGGPAGAAASIYSARKGLKTVIIAEKFGGQVQETRGIENLISVTYTEGPQLAAQLVKHVSEYPIEQLEHCRVSEIKKGEKNSIHFDSGESLSSQSIIIATGARWRELGVPGEKEYLGRGVAFCPHCDGPFYKGKKVAVVGGGNSGVEAAIDLAGIVGSVVLVEYNDQLKADQVLINKLKSMPNVSIITSAKTTQLVGDGQKIVAFEYLDRKTEKIQKVDLDGVFIQIGLLPNSSFAKGVLELSKFGEIIIDDKCRTSVPGIYAAGDVTTVPYKQIIIAMGEGAKAALASFEDRMKL
jgi:alkyl hydroperoxide reductase subunit F